MRREIIKKDKRRTKYCEWCKILLMYNQMRFCSKRCAVNHRRFGDKKHLLDKFEKEVLKSVWEEITEIEAISGLTNNSIYKQNMKMLRIKHIGFQLEDKEK